MYCSNHRLYTKVKALQRGEFELPPFHRRFLEASEIATPRTREFEKEIAKAFAYAGITHIDELAANHYVIWYQMEAQEDAGARDGVDALIRVEFVKRLRANDPQGWITEDALDLEFVSSERIDRDFGGGIAFYR